MIKKKISQIINKNNKIDVIINSAAVSIFTKYIDRTEQEINVARRKVRMSLQGQFGDITPQDWGHPREPYAAETFVCCLLYFHQKNL